MGWGLGAGAVWVSALAVGCGGDPCGSAQRNCDGTCVSVEVEDDHCGACGEACDPDRYCRDAKCELFCGAGRIECAGSCENALSDVTRCGACSTRCDEGSYCDAGACSSSCSGVLCPDSGGSSVCAHLESDPDHCGRCGVSCGRGEECEAGVCVAACAPGRVRCGDECVDPLRSAVHCGACGNGCAANVACVEGVCGGADDCTGEACPCPEDFVRCGGACVDPRSNPFQCGACGNECHPAEACVEGACVCPDGGLACGVACVDPDTNGAHCGACGTVCAGGKICEDGGCVCPAGTTECEDRCVDLAASPDHCGECGRECVGLESCDAGNCYYDAGDGCGGFAKNVDVEKVSLYQAVEVPLFVEGELVPRSERTADVVAGKDALVRVHLDLKSGFSDRVLSARFVVRRPGGPEQVFFRKKSVESDSVQWDLGSTLNVSVPGEALFSDSLYRVELVECSGAAVGSNGVTRLPEIDDEPLRARRTGPIRVVFVPFHFNDRQPDVSAATIEKYADDVLRQFGTTEVIASVHDRVLGPYSGTVDLSPLLDDVFDLRLEDEVERNVYYYGLVRSHDDFDAFCDDGSCTTGLAYVPEGAADFRVGVGIGFGDPVSTNTFAHELGHNHELDHAPCGGPDDADPDYPYGGASIGTWGYDVSAAQLKDPTSFTDLMGYCEPTWISDYHYSIATDVVADMNTSAFVVATTKIPFETLRVEPSGLSWGKSAELRLPASKRPERGVVYDEAGDEIGVVPVYRFAVSEGAGYRLLVPPRRSGWYAIGLEGGAALPYP